jgi:cytoskeletal protein CcmA (bactofilin family)
MANVPKTTVVATTPESEARLSEGAVFDGRWKGNDIAVQGRLEGELTLTGRLRIGRTGAVLGRVQADSVELGGEFTGEILARLIVITESARARGTFVSERLIVKEGAIVDGAFDRPKAETAPAAVAAPAQPPSPAPQRTPSSAQPAGSGSALAPIPPASGADKLQVRPDDTVPPKP